MVKTGTLGPRGPDFCAATRQAVAASAPASELGGGRYELRVVLTSLTATETDVSCSVLISVRSHSKGLRTVSSEATVTLHSGNEERDCVDSLVKRLIVKTMGPFMLRHAARVAGRASR